MGIEVRLDDAEFGEGPRALTRGPGWHDLPSAAASGRGIAFADMSWDNDLWSLPYSTARGVTSVDALRLTSGPASHRNPSLSRDGRWLAYLEQKAFATDLYLLDLQSNVLRQVTSSGNAGPPVVSADGKVMAFTEGLSTRAVLVGEPGLGPFRKVSGVWPSVRLYGISSGGRYLLARLSAGGAPDDRGIDVIDAASGEASIILKKPGVLLFQARLSPNDKWLAFLARTAPGRGIIQIAPFRGAEAIPAESWRPVGDGDKPRWTPDGRRLLFTSERDGFRCIWVQDVDPDSGDLIGPSQPFLHFHDSRRSLGNVSLAELEIDLSEDRLVIVQGEVSSNIWLLEFPSQ